MSKNSIKLHRIFSAPVERVYRAFTNPHATASWLPPYGFVCEVQSMQVEEGGSFKMSFINLTTDKAHSFGGEYLKVVPQERLQYVDRFDDPNLPGEIMTEILFKEVLCGTEISITQDGIPSVIPVEMCYLGWQDSLDKLKRLVESTIPDA